jgi:hypothetical protein
MATLDRARLTTLLDREQAAYTEEHPGSRPLFEQATNLFGRVPMTWMNMWSGGFPLYLDHATGNSGSCCRTMGSWPVCVISPPATAPCCHLPGGRWRPLRLTFPVLRRSNAATDT